MEPIVYRSHASRNLRIPGGHGRWCNFQNYHFTATEEWQKEAIENTLSFEHRAIIALPNDIPEEVVMQDPILRRAMRLTTPQTPSADVSPQVEPPKPEFPAERGDGWWTLSNGEMVRGRDAAIIRERIIARNPE